MKSGIRHRTDGMELSNQDKIRTLAENETWECWRLTPSNKCKWKTKFKKNITGELESYSRQNSSRNLIKGISTWAVPPVRYSGPFLKWTRDELKQMDQRKRRHYIPETMLTDYMFQEKREEEDLPALKDSVDASIQRLEDYIEKHEGGMITAIRNDTDNMMSNRITITRKQKWEGKQLYGHFEWLINTISCDKTWTLLRKGNLKRETESLLIAAQNNTI